MTPRLVAAVCLLFAQPAARVAPDEQLARHRNLGKAFYENPTTQNESVAEFRKALALAPSSVREKLNLGLALLRAADNPEGLKYLEEVQRLDPQLPHTWFNLGIHWKKQGESEKAVAQFAEFARLAPGEPKAHYNLGAAYKLAGDNAKALPAFERAAELDPRLAAARFQLFNGYRAAGRAAEAQKALAEFQRLKKEQEGAAIPEDVDWCDYAEIYDPAPLVTDIPANPRFQDRTLARNAAFALVFDVFGDKRPSLIAGLPDRVAVYRHGLTPAAPIAVAQATGAAAADFDNDGFADLCVLTSAGPRLLKNKAGVFTAVAVKWPAGSFRHALWVDYDHDYDLDLFLFGDRPALLRNEGTAGFADRTSAFPFRPGAVTEAFVTRLNPDSRAFDLFTRPGVLYLDRLGGRYEATTAPTDPPPPTNPVDFNLDGKPDRILLSGGELKVGLDTAVKAPNWIRVALTGVRNPVTSPDAWVEVKAGSLYRRARYDGLPLTFPVGAATTVDVVRITWPNGLIQNETRLAVNRAHGFKEAQRLSGSCPIIWTWDGQGFRYLTDVLGVAPLGASDGEGSFFATDHDETVQIPAGALVPRDGRYEIRVTEELSEAAYIDRLRLVAIDHPQDLDVYTNEKWKLPPFPEERLFAARQPIAPRAAIDHDGTDVRAALRAQDRTYPTGFRRNLSGIAETHHLTLDFGPDAAGADLLVLHGWVDWADGSTFLQASQARQPLTPPSLQMRDAGGRWVTVIEDMGMPAGKPKTIVVDLRGKWLSARREVRIVTNLCVYWDQIRLSAEVPFEAARREVPLLSAGLRFRGFSPSVIHPERAQPEQFSYANPEPTTLWNPTPGFYTRYGPVAELLSAADDRLLVMGSGDEIALSFDARALPPVPAGYVREFLLEVTGWAKDRDANTAGGERVQPLPFRRMSAYPYPRTERHPHPDYEQEWNTRPALVLLRSLQGSR